MPSPQGFDTFLSNANSRIIIQKPGLTSDGAGGQVNTWTDVFTAWSIINPTNGREQMSFRISRQGFRQSMADNVFTIRYNKILKQTKDIGAYRVSYDDRFFNILYIQNFWYDMKQDGTVFQKIFTTENAADLA